MHYEFNLPLQVTGDFGTNLKTGSIHVYHYMLSNVRIKQNSTDVPLMLQSILSVPIPGGPKIGTFLYAL